jgi:hypothetical protein
MRAPRSGIEAKNKKDCENYLKKSPSRRLKFFEKCQVRFGAAIRVRAKNDGF